MLGVNHKTADAAPTEGFVIVWTVFGVVSAGFLTIVVRLYPHAPLDALVAAGTIGGLHFGLAFLLLGPLSHGVLLEVGSRVVRRPIHQRNPWSCQSYDALNQVEQVPRPVRR